jgi:hypothetical protein
MATPIGYTLGALLCGSLPDLTTAAIRSIVTSDTSAYDNTFLSNITPSSNNFTSSIYNTQLVRDADSTFSSSSGVYLSASSTQFNNITSAFYDGSNTFYIYNYIDTGVASTSNIISYQPVYSTTIQGLTYYKINNNKILFFTDTADNTRFTYRYFNELLIKDSAGSLQNSTIGVALLSTSYNRDINHTSYTDISAHIIAEGTTTTYVTNDSNYAYLRPLNSFTPLLATQTGTGGSVVFYLNPSSSPSSRTLVCALSGPQVNYNTTSAELVYFRAYQNIIMVIQ